MNVHTSYTIRCIVSYYTGGFISYVYCYLHSVVHYIVHDCFHGDLL